MSDRDEYEALFHEHLPVIRKLIACTGRRLALRGYLDDFEAEVLERLWENEYEALRKWRGASKLTTYLTVVIANYGREFRVKLWGRWRPSAAAIDLGPLAIRLETLVSRDKMRLPEAGELLRTRGETTMSDRELYHLLAQLPRRSGEVQVPLGTVRADSGADDGVLVAETEAARRAIYARLTDTLARLDADERVIIQMHFLLGLSIADVARALHVPQRPLYRVKDRALVTLRHHLLDAGVTGEQLRQIIGGALDDAVDLRDDGHPRDVSNAPADGNPDAAGPSNEVCDSNPGDEASGSSDSVHSERSDR